MGARGPLKTPNARRRASNDKAGGSSGPSKEIEPVGGPVHLAVRPPAGLGVAGRALWRDIQALVWLHPSDRAAATHLCRLEDEREALQVKIDELGLMLSEPIVTPKGEVVGERLVANPLLGELRKLEKSIADLRAPLGLTPMARGRLGLQIVEVERKSAQSEAIMAKYRRAASTK